MWKGDAASLCGGGEISPHPPPPPPLPLVLMDAASLPAVARSTATNTTHFILIRLACPAQEGTDVQDIDSAIARFGMAIGPFVMGDIAGNDIGVSIR